MTVVVRPPMSIEATTAGARPLAIREGAISAALLLLLAINLLSALRAETITTDEFVHIPAGYAYLTNRDFRPNNEHPPLAKLWSALPLIALSPVPPPPDVAADPEKRTIRTARAFWDSNAPRFDLLAFWARVPMIVLTLALGATIFGYTRKLFGSRAAMLAIALFTLEPTILAHGRVVHTDVPAALAYLGCFVTLGWYAEQPTFRRAIVLGLVTGAALATKYSLLALLPVVGVVLLAMVVLAPLRGRRRMALAAQVGAVVLVALIVVNAAYLFRHQPLNDLDVSWVREQDPAAAAAFLFGVHLLSPVVPPYYLLGAFTVLRHDAVGHPAALLGNYSTQGWWYYFPVAFGLKTTIPFLIVAIGSLLGALWALIRRRDRRMLLLLGPLAFYSALAMGSHIDIGIRHLLPAFPFLFVLGGATLDRVLGFRRGRLLGTAVVTLLIGWMAIEAIRAYPNYLNYTNQLTFGKPGWQLLSDSNVEWGEDTAALARYLHARGETSVRAAISGGLDTLGYYGITYEDLLTPAVTPQVETRYVAIGASFLNGAGILVGGQPDPDYFAEYRSRAPDAVFGNSIFLFRARPPLPPLSAALAEGGFRATLTATTRIASIHANQAATLHIQVGNASSVQWPAAARNATQYQILLGDRWLDASDGRILRDDSRVPLPYALYPGEQADMRLTIKAPEQPGEYLLEIDLVQEDVAWFGDRGATPIKVRLRVNP